MALRLARRAAADIRRIHAESLRLFGRAQADRYVEELRRVMRLVAESPGLARERRELAPPARIHPCGSHVIVYVIEADGGVLVVRVRHGREDWGRAG